MNINSLLQFGITVLPKLKSSCLLSERTISAILLSEKQLLNLYLIFMFYTNNFSVALHKLTGNAKYNQHGIVISSHIDVKSMVY